MRRTQNALFLAGLLFGSLSLVPAAQAEGDATDTVPPPPQVQQQAPADAQPQQGDNPDSSGQPPLGPNAEEPEAGSTPSPAPDANAGSPQAQSNYDLNRIIIDYKDYKIGDNVPQQYLDKSYNIVEWQKRNLPAPETGSHWTYIGGNYLLITNDVGKILKAESGDIYYRG
ncbi:RcnB family protein [Pantoea sp. RRHST58]|uniref:RcnB family protein n=1 Tax=Pantoea sp. RRHST58 TaxID=3425183 RepID=UPI003D9FF03F